MEMNGLMGGLYRIAEWIMRLSAINLLWLICSIPFFIPIVLFLAMSVTGDVSAATNQDVMILDLFKMTYILCAIIAPFFLFPATAAMFSVARKWIIGQEDAPLFMSFFRGYKENYLKSMLGGLIFSLIGTILIVDYYVATQSSNQIIRLLTLLFIVLFVIFTAAFFNFFSVLVHFEMNLKTILKNSFLLSIGQPISSIVILIINGFIMYISTQYTFLIPFFMGSLIAYASFWMFHQNFKKIKNKQEMLEKKKAENEDEAAQEPTTE